MNDHLSAEFKKQLHECYNKPPIAEACKKAERRSKSDEDAGDYAVYVDSTISLVWVLESSWGAPVDSICIYDTADGGKLY